MIEQEKCPHCEWWKNKKRPHETFILLLWEWDIDRARKLAPVEEGMVEVAKLAKLIDYPKGNTINLFSVAINEGHIDHVPLDAPLLFGTMTHESGDSHSLLIDGHHRLARAIKEGVKTLPYHLLSAAQLTKCCIGRPPKPRKKRRK